ESGLLHARWAIEPSIVQCHFLRPITDLIERCVADSAIQIRGRRTFDFNISPKEPLEDLMHNVLGRRKGRGERTRIREQTSTVLFVESSELVAIQPPHAAIRSIPPSCIRHLIEPDLSTSRISLVSHRDKV